MEGRSDSRFWCRKYQGRRILVTGHTGFKGSWLCTILKELGAEVVGYALPPNTKPSLFELAKVSQRMISVIGDVRDLEGLHRVFEKYQPEYVFHLAAQPIVREGYRDPVGTYSANVMGTVNLMECIRESDSVVSVVNVTTDKVYENRETDEGYVEEERLDGYDPYSNSKSCSELVTHCYVNSFLREKGIAVSTCRAGNVIGGGDFEKDRIIPDCVRALMRHETVIVRNPLAVRPYQHVLEPLFVYLMIAVCQAEEYSLSGAYNVGPDERDCLTTGELVERFGKAWGDGFSWCVKPDGGPHEAKLLRLSCEKIKKNFCWKPRLTAEDALGMVVDWTRSWFSGQGVQDCMKRQIREYMARLI